MVSDYGASRNLFGQGKAAMYLMGSWEMGLATDTNFSDEFRANVDAFKFPRAEERQGQGRRPDGLVRRQLRRQRRRASTRTSA